MTRPPYPSTPEQAHAWFNRHGICIAEWCRENHISRYAVFDLLRGKRKGLRGKTHHAAVLLGLKPDPEAQESKRAA